MNGAFCVFAEGFYISSGTFDPWPFPFVSSLGGKMQNVQAVVTCRCAICRLLIAEDCVRLGMKVPEYEKCGIPVRWVGRTCPHMAEGLSIVPLNGLSAILPDTSKKSLRWKQEGEMDVPVWRSNLDFTKNWGFPCREQGRYGSHPSHDGFGDDSNP
jgi:hypothetical protein